VVLISPLGNPRSSGDAVEFAALARYLRPPRRFVAEPDVRDRHRPDGHDPGPTPTIVGMRFLGLVVSRP
jgi:hypothetical protein